MHDFIIFSLILILISLLIVITIYTAKKYEEKYPTTVGIDNNYFLDVSSSTSDEKKTLYKFGYAVLPDADTEYTVRAGVDTTSLVDFPEEAFTAFIVSDNANDTVEGIGARKVTISGLDQNYDEKNVTVDLDGTTLVQLGDENSWIRIFRGIVIESGTNGGSVGTLTFRNNGGTSVYGIIQPNENQTLIGAYTVPRNYTLYLDDITFTAAISQANKVFVVKFQTKNFGTNTFNTKFKNTLQSDSSSYNFKYPYKINERTDIRMRAECDTASADVSGTFQGILIKNN